MDAALGRVALVLRVIGAVWMVVLATVYALVGDLDAPTSTAAVALGGALWATLSWRAGWIDRGVGNRWAVLAADLVVTCAVILVPGLLDEGRTVSGGYPFAALLVGLAAAGRRGVVVAAVVLCAATLASVAAVGSSSLPVVVGNVLLYLLGALALWAGIDVIRGNERRVRAAESALAVAEERATTAAHLHDSVLQTLALVQRRAEDAGSVRSLARRQERELRDWLFPPAGPDADPAADLRSVASTREGRQHVRTRGPAGATSLGTALETHAEEVQARYGVAVAVVTVAGAGRLLVPDDERAPLPALVLAAREAMTNAAVHAGVGTVDLFVETDAEGVAVYVRDRGVGFDLAAVPDDRHGVRGSIIGRMERAGGSATIRSTAGRGTEVRLLVPHSTPGAARASGTTGGSA